MAKKPTAPPADDRHDDQKAPAKAKAPAFVFIGDEVGHGPDTITFMGYTFEKKGRAVEVSNPAVAKKLAANGHFKAA